MSIRPLDADILNVYFFARSNISYEDFAQEIVQKNAKCALEKGKNKANMINLVQRTYCFQFARTTLKMLRKDSRILRGRTPVCP